MSSSLPSPTQREYKRFLEIYLTKDWSWVTPDNKRLLSDYKVKHIGGGYLVREHMTKEYFGNTITHPDLLVYPDLVILRDTFILISVAIEKYNIQEEIPCGIFEDIGSYL